MSTEDVYRVRLANVERLAAERGGPATLCRDLGYRGRTPGAIFSQWKAGRKITEKVAREIEGKLELPPGWLDKPHDGPPAPAPDIDLLLEVNSLVQSIIQDEGRKVPSRDKYKLLIEQAYNRSSATGGIDEKEIRALIYLAT